MIGIKYLRYHPRAIFQLPSGLTIYESVFENADGGRGVIGGPHKVFNSIKKHQAQDKHPTNILFRSIQLVQKRISSESRYINVRLYRI